MLSERSNTDMTKHNYTTIAHHVYGTACEFIAGTGSLRCNWSKATCDVHHIDYQAHNAAESAQGKQLEKNNSSINLCVLCPNHHRFVHHEDLGPALLDHLPIRSNAVKIEITKLGNGGGLF